MKPRASRQRPSPAAVKAQGFEVHEHVFISGPRSRFSGRIVHSHAGGDVVHAHPETGPSAHTIDRDDWAAASNGLRGGSRKQFTATPSGEQLPLVAVNLSYTVVSL